MKDIFKVSSKLPSFAQYYLRKLLKGVKLQTRKTWILTDSVMSKYSVFQNKKDSEKVSKFLVLQLTDIIGAMMSESKFD